MKVLEAQLHEEVLVGRSGEPYASQTLLGSAKMGPLNSNIRSQSDKINVNFLKHASEMLDKQISQLLGLENIDSISNSKKDKSVLVQDALGKLNTKGCQSRIE